MKVIRTTERGPSYTENLYILISTSSLTNLSLMQPTTGI